MAMTFHLTSPHVPLPCTASALLQIFQRMTTYARYTVAMTFRICFTFGLLTVIYNWCVCVSEATVGAQLGVWGGRGRAILCWLLHRTTRSAAAYPINTRTCPYPTPI